MNKHQKEALFGPSSQFSEHREGDVVLVRRGTDIRAGAILHIRASGPAIQCGTDHPLLYMVDTNEGMPVLIEPAMIIEGSFTAVIATYGDPVNGDVLTREAAENLAGNVIGQIIDSAGQGRLRVLKARIEGDERQGRVIAECEAVVESEQKGQNQ